MRRQIVRPQTYTQVEGDCAPATRVGGLYGMDLEGGNEDLEMEQDEFEGFEGLDAGNPAEAQESLPRLMTPGSSRPLYCRQPRKSPSTTPRTVLSGAGVRHASPPAQRKILTREERNALLRWACQWCKWIMISWRST